MVQPFDYAQAQHINLVESRVGKASRSPMMGKLCEPLDEWYSTDLWCTICILSISFLPFPFISHLSAYFFVFSLVPPLLHFFTGAIYHTQNLKLKSIEINKSQLKVEQQAPTSYTMRKISRTPGICNNNRWNLKNLSFTPIKKMVTKWSFKIFYLSCLLSF
jgi:hypothetical protein